jgi:hypothetical protein
MRLAARFLLVVALLACAGCRRGPDGPIDPTSSGLAVCPSSHLVIGLRAPYDQTQAIARFTMDLAPCRGAALPTGEHGTISAVGALSDGTDLVGFSDSYGGSGTLARVDGASVTAEIDDEEAYPISIAPLTYGGQPAVAVVWGDGGSSTNSGERLDVYAEVGLAPLASFTVSSELISAAAAPSGQPARLAGLIAGGLQEYRPELASLATTGELQVALPSGVYYRRSLDVRGDEVRVASREGVASWRAGTAPAFLGPVHCRWPDTVDTRLPGEAAEYVTALVDPRAPGDSLVLVTGELEGGSVSTSHLFVLRPRGECLLFASMPENLSGAGMALSP